MQRTREGASCLYDRLSRYRRASLFPPPAFSAFLSKFVLSAVTVSAFFSTLILTFVVTET